jgi:hypothetical protein
MQVISLAVASLEAQAATVAGSVWPILGCIAAGGFVGGLVNALLSDNGFPLLKQTMELSGLDLSVTPSLEPLQLL